MSVEVKSTIDLRLQKNAQQTVNDMLDTEAVRYRATQAALVTMQPDGAIKAIVGGRDYENSQFNRATDALRQPGSAFKPFVYLAALENGFNPNSIVRDGPVSIGNWSPKNYSHKYAGRTTLAPGAGEILQHCAGAPHAPDRAQDDHRDGSPGRNSIEPAGRAVFTTRHQRSDRA